MCSIKPLCLIRRHRSHSTRRVALLIVLLASIELCHAYYHQMRPYARAGRQNEYQVNGKHQMSQMQYPSHKPNKSYPTKTTLINDNFVTNYNKERRYVDEWDKSMNRQYTAHKGPVSAAVNSKFSVEYLDVHIPQEEMEPQVIEITGSIMPIVLHFKSLSSPIRIQQMHHPAPTGEIQETSSEDEPHRLMHTVTKPIIQEVREIITPYRKIIQEIQPVQEQIQTIVARANSGPSYPSEQTGPGYGPKQVPMADYATKGMASAMSVHQQSITTNNSNIRILH